MRGTQAVGRRRAVIVAMLAASLVAPSMARAQTEEPSVFGAPQVVAPGAVRGAGYAYDGSLAVVSSQESAGTTTFWRAERGAAASSFAPAEPLAEEAGRPRGVAYTRTLLGQEALVWARADAPDLQVRVRAIDQPFGAVERLPRPERAPVKPGNETVTGEPSWLSLGVAVASDGALAVGGCEVDYRSETYRALVYFRPPGVAGQWREMGRCMAAMRVRSDATGRIDVLWSGAPDGAALDAPRVIWVASRAPGAPGFAPKQGLSDPTEDADNNSAEPHLLTAPTGEALALWNAGEYPVGNRALLAIRDVTGRWGPPQRVSGSSPAFRPSVATNVHGAIAVAWSSGQELATTLRSPGKAFEAPVLAPAGEVGAETLPLALDSFETIVAVGRAFRDGRVFAMRRLRSGATLPPVPVTERGIVANDLRLETDPFGNGALVWSGFPVGRPAEAQATVAPYSTRPPLLEAVKVGTAGVSFDLDEPARITVSARSGRRIAAESSFVTPRPGRETVRAGKRLRTLLRARGTRRVVIRARDAGPGLRRVRRVLRRR
jgi:hypothetical protein